MDEFGWHVFAEKFGKTKQDCRLSVAAVRPGRSHIEARDNYGEQVANANLIAAAPEMLAALQGLMPHMAENGMVGETDFERAVLAAQAAIEKATT